jgi:hypothetical protein
LSRGERTNWDLFPSPGSGDFPENLQFSQFFDVYECRIFIYKADLVKEIMAGETPRMPEMKKPPARYRNHAGGFNIIK